MKYFLIEKNVRVLTFFVCMQWVLETKAQTIVFNETFGQTATRTTSSYMPANSYAYGNPNGIDNEKSIENNYYAVIAPANIRDAWPVPNWWFWTGPEPVNNTFGGLSNAATDDHTGGTDGAVMVVNAGTTLQPFYKRAVRHLTPGNYYSLSFWLYVVNPSSTIGVDVEDVGTGASLANYNTGFLFTAGVWTNYIYNFQAPAGCSVSSIDVNIKMSNALPNNHGNDYYVDDIVLTNNGATGTGSALACPINAMLPVSLLSFSAGMDNNHAAVIDWKVTGEEGHEQYIVERSVDGHNFLPVQLIPSSGKNSYHYTEEISVLKGDNIYYRLKTQDIAGVDSYSGIARVTNVLSSVKRLYAWNGAFNNQLSVKILSNENASATIQIINLMGQTVHLQKEQIVKGENLFFISKRLPSKGIYFVRAILPTETLASEMIMK